MERALAFVGKVTRKKPFARGRSDHQDSGPLSGEVT